MLPWITQAAVVYSVLSLVVVLGLGNAARRLAWAVHKPLDRRGVRTPGNPDGAGERDTEAVRRGLSYQEIGEIRNNSALTVRNAVSGLQRKLGFKTRQQMVVWAVRTGLVDGGLP